MNTTLSKSPRVLLLGALVTFLAACTTQSGPTYTLRAVSVPNQQAPIYRVNCEGLFESAKSCVRVAGETCKTQPVTWLEAVDRVSDAAPKKDPRELTFMCGKPVVEQPVSQPPVAQQPVPPQPAAQPQAKQAVPQVRLLLQGNANFATDSAMLSPIAKKNLDHFMSVNQGINLHRLTVVGYTDATGSEAHNLNLSQARAAAVVQYLRDGGLHVDQFVARGLGSADPVASNATAEGRMQNRRVDVRVFAE
ncbi:outer membrane protein/peptidoglycan-associated (lipo)protein [Burkholderia sp. Ch1-1]|uniref:Outer membrane protein/peptidoglycan-associated (Lipo)protein n=1 Tax=Paraburkholderia dioscoreae TaxID=2604047 RepID=A0A5Q4ZCW3_9BURK|nr:MULTISPECIES: OmpA family protein [Paraburkholderia]EIF29680.1 outer membrane protein/peptidoglycan-associated (lipo)protein [Burkholderia sp. Ch1-1]MDR8396895.1 OmpA family protein [Paraburkholderia sp. USG1]VVD30241.1 Outer membrane protein/peptidoglycan-associated (Lipo)protein [Paraburkholderia dioscoreae]